MEEIYVVTAGCYSDYHIEAIFKDRAKAEFYCTCHEDCEIKEYNFSDNRIFTPFNMVIIYFTIRKNGNDKTYFRFRQLSKEDDSYYLENRDSISVYYDWMTITLYRELPKNYDEQKIKDKYTKAYQDLKAEILYLLSESDCSSYENRKVVGENIKEYIKERFGIEEQ